MIVGQLPLAEASISQVASNGGDKKAPPKRTMTVAGDRKLVPEPR